jgi:broad specificity phosphatase PhoE
VSKKRRTLISQYFHDTPLLFIECINDNEDIVNMNITKKIQTAEFSSLSPKSALETFSRRIEYYKLIYYPLSQEENFIKIDSLHSKIIDEKITITPPYYDLLRDLLVTDIVKSLFLIRHGETYFNLENRIGGDSPLTERGREQAHRLGIHFSKKRIPKIFTSTKVRCIETAQIISSYQPKCEIIKLKEFDEINSGVCEGMSYEEIREKMPEVYESRKKDKFHYIYPQGEGYVTMKDRIDLGIKKALHLSGAKENIMIVGHRAVNRMILAHFLYRREEDVPYIYIPQDQYYHIVSTERKKLFELRYYA